MATTEQITSGAGALAAVTSERYIGDDWVFPFEFTDSAGDVEDVSAYTFTAYLIYETSGYTATAITGTDGVVNSSEASTGTITVTVYDALTSTLTADKDSVDTSGERANTRLALLKTSGVVTTTVAIMPIKVIRR